MRTRARHTTAVGTVGLLEVKPGAPNVVPGEVFFMIDMRDPDAAVLDRMESDIAADADKIAEELGLTIALKNISAQPPRPSMPIASPPCARRRRVSGLFHPRHDLRRRPRRGLCGARRADRDDLRALQGRHQPQRSGISSKEQCAAGAQVLLQAVLDYDRQLAERLGGK